MYLPKQRGKRSFRLSRADLAPTPALVQFSGFDIITAATKYSPQKYSENNFPEVPVYCREKNEIRRFSRLASAPHLASLVSALCGAKNAATSQPTTTNDLDHTDLKMSGHVNEGNFSPAFGQSRYGDWEPMLENKPTPTPTPSMQSTSEWTASKAPSASSGSNASKKASRNCSSPSQSAPVLGKEPSSDHETKSQKNTPINPSEFPRFVPKFQPRFRSNIRRFDMDVEPQYDHPIITPNIDRDSDSSDAGTPGTSASSTMTSFSNRHSNTTSASSETDLLSVEMCEPVDIASYYEDTDELLFEDNQNKQPGLDLGTPAPTHPVDHVSSSKHSAVPAPTIVVSKPAPSKAAPKAPSLTEHTRPNSRALGTSSFDFCLDLGAEYDKSRFMIPLENQVQRLKKSHHRHSLVISTRRVSGAPADIPETSEYRRPVSGGHGIFSSFRSGVGRMLK